MRISSLFFNLFTFFFPPALIGTVGLYLYAPLLDCTFPVVRRAVAGCSIPGKERDAIPAEIAPFRLLAFGDPQLEGDTSLPGANDPLFPSLGRFERRVKRDGLRATLSHLSSAGGELLGEDLPKILQGYRKRLDLWGNDLYLAHIYRSVSWWSEPTHTVVLGDLLGSQHIDDEEFKRRSDRLWGIVFPGLEKVPRTVTDVSGRSQALGEDGAWKRRLIAVAGNHDIGYAGDIDEHRIERFEETYGSVNWETRFRLENGTSHLTRPSRFNTSPLSPPTPELRIIVLNSMNLDGPAKKPVLQDQSRDFIGRELYTPTIATTGTTGTVLLTHIPFHKEAGVCTDPPFFDYFPPYQGGGVKEQNHLNEPSTDYILDGLAGAGRPGKAIVLNGHDHEGCDTYHYRSASASSSEPDEPTDAGSRWQAKHYRLSRSEIANDSLTGVREITVRSMMGSFGGNVGFLSAWFDKDDQEWKFEYNSCWLGVQHIWWAVHVLDLIVVGFGLTSLFAFLWEDMSIRTDLIVKQEGPKLKGE